MQAAGHATQGCDAKVQRLPEAEDELEVAPEVALETAVADVPVAVTTVLNWRAAIGTRLETSGARSAVTDPCHGHVWRQAFHNLTPTNTSHEMQSSAPIAASKIFVKLNEGFDMESSDWWQYSMSLVLSQGSGLLA